MKYRKLAFALALSMTLLGRMRRIGYPRFLRGSRAVLRGSRCGILRPGRVRPGPSTRFRGAS